MNNLKDIHNKKANCCCLLMLFYQDFNEQFEGYTQHNLVVSFSRFCCFIRISMNNLKDIHNSASCCFVTSLVVLSGFQWTIWRIYTTEFFSISLKITLFYQDFNEQFEGYTQRRRRKGLYGTCCFIRISMNNLKDIHNRLCNFFFAINVVLSGFQWTIWRIYTTIAINHNLNI